MRFHSCLGATRGDDRWLQDVFLRASPEELAPADHPLRPIRAMADEALPKLNDSLDEIRGYVGRPPIAAGTTATGVSC